MAIATIAPPTAPTASTRNQWSYVVKVALAAALVGAGDDLFFLQRGGATIGLFALVLLAATLVARPVIWHHRPAIVAAAGAALAGLILIDDPNALAAALFWVGLVMATLLPRAAGFDHAGRWFIRLILHALLAPVALVTDGDTWRKTRARRGGGRGIVRKAPLLVLPIAGGIVFLGLFAAANPIIGDALARIDLGLMLGIFSFWRIAFWLALLILCWSVLRPHALVRLSAIEARGEIAGRSLSGVSVGSVMLSLLLFNVLFAVQNALDIAFLWSGTPLPAGMTLAEYAHRGAYPLIVTALLAGGFVLMTTQPGTDMAARGAIRRLVGLWVAQNILLVASSILRTLDYIDAFSLTRLRIAALVWMVLVAIGLALICWRLLRGRSGAWLVNANAMAALLALSACAIIDLGAVAASYNVRHAREAGGRGPALDFCYLDGLGAAALVAVTGMEASAADPAFRERAAWSRNRIMDRLEVRQADWRGWTFRNARRLAAARALIAAHDLPRRSAGIMGCDGILPAPAPLTGGPVR